MDDLERARFVESRLDQYVADRIAAGEVPEQARTTGSRQWAEYFPSGEPAAGHRLYRLLDAAEPVGYLWVGPNPTGQPGMVWVFYVEVDEARRGSGLGRAAMVLAEEDARAHGATELGLNVFGPNTVARHLYESLGFEPTAINMVKQLRP